MSDEEWAPVPEFQNYEVSTLGRIRTKRRPRVKGGEMKPFLRGGYPSVQLRNDTGRFNLLMHRLVLSTFKPRSDAFSLEAAHVNGDKMDWRLSNLCWATKAENEDHKRRHGTALYCEATPSAKLTNEQVSEIRLLRRTETQMALAERFGVGRTCIQRIQGGQTWTRLND